MEAISDKNQFGESASKDVIRKLLDDKVITETKLKALMDEVSYTNQNPLQALIDSHLVSESVINSYMSGDKIQSINLSEVTIGEELTGKIPKDIALSNRIIAFDETEKDVKIAMANTEDYGAIDYVRNCFGGKDVKPYYAKESDILATIDKFYEYSFTIGNIIDELEANGVIANVSAETNYKSPVIRFFDAIMSDAVHKKASDIHIQPDEFFVRVRYRMDGVMQNQFTFHKKFYSSIIVRIKIVSGMNIAESLRPQDGGIESIIMGRRIDFRVSIMPTIFGEGVVIRILDRGTNIVSIEKLGLLKENEEKMRKIMLRPEGVMIVTGPTGSGKTTTLYAILSEISSPHINMMTLEDPVEYHIALAKQVSINPAAGIDFASGLRAILRQDPDVILVGEMRDEETAITAMRAAMTGHKVYTTLHTNDAVSAINRLLDLKISRHIIASSVNGIIAQRLMRKLCPDCKIKRPIKDSEYETYRIKKTDKPIYVYDAAHTSNCKTCSGTSYIGRVTVTEIILFDHDIKSMVEDGINEYELMKKIKADKKFTSMQVDGIKKVLCGITCFKELKRSVNMSDYM